MTNEGHDLESFIRHEYGPYGPSSARQVAEAAKRFEAARDSQAPQARAPQPANPAQSAKAINVYVRLAADGDNKAREISWRYPEDITPQQLLDQGWALDGNEAVQDVRAYQHDFRGRVSMVAALREVQQGLVTWLDERGYTVVFK